MARLRRGDLRPPGRVLAGILLKKTKLAWRIEIFERHQPDDTFSFGVVFSDDTLNAFLHRDRPVHDRIRDKSSYWQDIVFRLKGHEIHCGGNGFCAMSRRLC